MNQQVESSKRHQGVKKGKDGDFFRVNDATDREESARSSVGAQSRGAALGTQHGIMA